MIRSVLKKTCLPLFLLLLLPFLSFKAAPDTLQMVQWSNQCLNRVYDPAEEKLKKWELTLSDDFFLRLRKTYQTGKQEYFSFRMHSFDDLDYRGTAASGMLTLKTKADNIIVQTYNDRKGNVDSMATSLTIPVKNIEPEQLDSLRKAMLQFRDIPPATLR